MWCIQKKYIGKKPLYNHEAPIKDWIRREITYSNYSLLI